VGQPEDTRRLSVYGSAKQIQRVPEKIEREKIARANQQQHTRRRATADAERGSIELEARYAICRYSATMFARCQVSEPQRDGCNRPEPASLDSLCISRQNQKNSTRAVASFASATQLGHNSLRHDPIPYKPHLLLSAAQLCSRKLSCAADDSVDLAPHFAPRPFRVQAHEISS
jgi:hypothetical protein